MPSWACVSGTASPSRSLWFQAVTRVGAGTGLPTSALASTALLPSGVAAGKRGAPASEAAVTSRRHRGRLPPSSVGGSGAAVGKGGSPEPAVGPSSDPPLPRLGGALHARRAPSPCRPGSCVRWAEGRPAWGQKARSPVPAASERSGRRGAFPTNCSIVVPAPG